MVTVLTTSGVYYAVDATYADFTEGILKGQTIESRLNGGKRILFLRDGISAVLDGEI